MNKNTDFKSFQLSEELMNSINGLGYGEPTPVQQEVIPLALAQKDILVKSKTGSGKTASYGIPICELVDWMENKPQALILTPTRELAVQVKEDMINLGRFKRLKTVAVFGRQPFDLQKTQLKQKAHIVAGTPGRILDHMERGTIHLEKVGFLVIDEADEMLNMGFIDQVEKIIKALPKDRVTMLFSATMPDAIKRLAVKYMKDPVFVEIETEPEETGSIEHGAYEVTEEEKLDLLSKVLVVENPDSCILFCQTKERVDMVYKALKKKGCTCGKIHGGLEQDDRLEVMRRFRKGEFRYLVATDIAARGIDIEHISLVINYDLPARKEQYVHRIGRTARAGRDGRALSFVTSRDKRYFEDIEAFLDQEIPVLALPEAEELHEKQADFNLKMMTQPEQKQLKSEQLNHKIMKLYFNGGKKKKLRAVDFVGTISKIEGIEAGDIGIITILDTVTYVEILNGKGSMVLKAMKETPVKGKLLRVSKAHKEQI